MACSHVRVVMQHTSFSMLGAEYRVLMAIALHIGEGGEEAFVGRETIKSLARVEVETVTRCINKAINCGELVVSRSKGRPSLYKLGAHYDGLLEESVYTHVSTAPDFSNSAIELLANEVREMKEMIAKIAPPDPRHTPDVPLTYPRHTPDVPLTWSRLELHTKLEDRSNKININTSHFSEAKKLTSKKRSGEELLEKLLCEIESSDGHENVREIYDAVYRAIKKHHSAYKPESSGSRKALKEALPIICKKLTPDEIKDGWESNEGFFHEKGRLTSPRQISAFAWEYEKLKKPIALAVVDEKLWDQVLEYVRNPNDHLDKNAILSDNSNSIHRGILAVGNNDFARGVFAIKNRDQYTREKIKKAFLDGTNQ